MMIDAREPQVVVRTGAQDVQELPVRGRRIGRAAGDLIEQRAELRFIHRGNRWFC